MNEENFRITGAENIAKIALFLGAIGLLLSVIGYFVSSEQFFHSYLVALIFWVSIAVGGLFLTMLHHITGATWSVVIRRFYENILSVLPYLFVLFIPVLFGIHNLYHWSHKDVVTADPMLLRKSGYLNSGFFAVRTILYFVIWVLLGRTLYNESIRQDRAGKAVPLLKAKKLSAPGVILYALTFTFASFDWLMSLDAHWYSTIFGVYVFGGSTLAVLSFSTFMLLLLRNNGVLDKVVTVEHYHDLGKLLFTFCIFWAYIAFSQYFLIWYANIPEETIWFQHRWIGSWKIISLVIAFGLFAIPFFTLMIRSNKRNFAVLSAMSLWILLMHWFDIYWMVMPDLHHEGAHFSWMDVSTFLGVGGIFMWAFWKKLISNPLVPVNDPYLQKSIAIKNY